MKRLVIKSAMAISIVAANQHMMAQEVVQEEVIVTGVRESLKEALAAKKNAAQIMDAISSEDIGKLPDNNIAEALQRVTGVQIDRNGLGEGSGFQVRGLSQNRVEINGNSLGGTDVGGRSNAFDTTSSSLVKSVEVIKSPTADMVEGALGATVRLKTFRPLEFKDKTTVNIGVEGREDSLADDMGYNVKGLFAHKFDLADGQELGVLLNVSQTQDYVKLDQFSHNMRNWEFHQDNKGRADKEQIIGSNRGQIVDKDADRDIGFPQNYPVFKPQFAIVQTQAYEQTRDALDLNLHWANNENLELWGQVTHTNNEQEYARDRIRMMVQNRELRIADPAANPDDPYNFVIQEFTRPGADFYYTQDAEGNYSPYQGDVTRGVLTRARFTSPHVNAPKVRYSTTTTTGRINAEANGVDKAQLAANIGGEWAINDRLTLDFSYARSESEQNNDHMFTNYDPRFFILDENREIVNTVVPDIIFDKNVTTDLNTFNLDFSNVNQALLDSGISQAEIDSSKLASLENLDAFTWQEVGGTITDVTNEEDAFQLDLDFDFDQYGFTTFETGLRSSSQKLERYQVRINILDPNRNPFARINPNFGIHSIFSQNWFNEDVVVDGNGDPVVDGNGNHTLDTSNDVNRALISFADIRNFDPELVEGFFEIPSADLMWQNDSGNIPRRWVSPAAYDRGLWQQTLDKFFPTRPARQIACDEAACAGADEMIGTADDEAKFTQEYFGWGYRPNAGQIFDIKEDVNAFYLKANYDFDIGIPVTGNVGLRHARTSVTTTAAVRSASNDFSLFTTEVEYSNTLPSLNANFELQDDLFLRFAYAKAMTRPNPQDMGGSIQVNSLDNTTGIGQIAAGNPGLRPFISNQYDLSLEWYYSDTNSVSAALFYKDMSNFIETVTTTEDLDIFEGINNEVGNGQDENGVPILVDGQPLDTAGPETYTVRSKQNTVDGQVQGLELQAQFAFDFLPEPFDGFGTLMNYTFIDSEQKGTAANFNIFDELTGEILPIADLSETSYNFILYYEKFGFSFRAAYNWRESFYKNQTAVSNDVDIFVPDSEQEGVFSKNRISLARWQADYGQLDLSASYKWEDWTFTAAIRNLLEDPRIRYVGGDERLMTNYDSQASLVTFGVSYRGGF